MDEENREYIVEYMNTTYKEAEFCIKGELINKNKGEWHIDLTDKEIDKKMYPEDIKDKAKLQVIAKKIIEDFNKNNKDNDIDFLDYMKIGMWVYKNIQYDLNYAGQIQYNALDTYNIRRGVCHHFIRLSNALLYSLGYKTIYVSGYACQNCREFQTSIGHAWSLVKLKNNKWYPFDSTYLQENCL